jgi:hypothetical protein
MTTLAYLQRWFVTHRGFCTRTGAAPDLVDSLIAARAMPGVIYAREEAASHGWWSALAAAGEPPPEAGRWYAPAAIWWARRALLGLKAGQSIAAAAESNRRHFQRAFADALFAEPLASLAFPQAFVAGSVDIDAAMRCADAEWQSWVDGGYAVCLQRFSAESCVRKESLARRIRYHVDTVPGYDLTPGQLFDLVERLESLMLPFAPWQRPTGTPGRAVDAALTALGIGAELPYETA